MPELLAIQQDFAGALADAGSMVVRYDKRGIGQSGGRAESASLNDYAEDVRAAIKMLENRKDVDLKRIAVVGHSEGGLVALIAASKEKKIAAVGLIATPGITGADIVLAQQQRLLNRMRTNGLCGGRHRGRLGGESSCGHACQNE